VKSYETMYIMDIQPLLFGSIVIVNRNKNIYFITYMRTYKILSFAFECHASSCIDRIACLFNDVANLNEYIIHYYLLLFYDKLSITEHILLLVCFVDCTTL
jgi:hypothetical protein